MMHPKQKKIIDFISGQGGAETPTMPAGEARKEVPNGMITLDSEFAKVLGFTSDKFGGWLWRKGKYIYSSFIVSKEPGTGNFRRLVERILELGYGVKIPTPIGVMEIIVRKWGFKRTEEYDEDVGEYAEVWVKEPGSRLNDREAADKCPMRDAIP